MILVKTPFRMSFVGGGTDLPEYFNNNRGAVIVTTFDKYVYLTIRHLPRFFNYTTELSYSKIERVNKLDDLQHPMVRNAMKYLDMHELHIAYDADLPARSGLGTSSTFAVGLLNGCYRLKDKYASAQKLADDAIYVERVLCQEAGGWQDQIAVAFGGFNRIDFKNNTYKVTPINISEERKKELNNNLLLFFTGLTRLSSDIQKETKSSLEDAERRHFLDEMLPLVDEAQEILENEDRNLDDFGVLLNKTWELKKRLSSSISNDSINEVYDKVIAAGALGGKLLGAGGGGFLVFYVPKNRQKKVRRAVKLMEVPFGFTNTGSEIIYQTPEVYDISENVEE